MTPRVAQVLGGCINMMFMFGSILPSIALDRMGRRKTMMTGCFSLGICMLMISALLSQADRPNGHAYASASVTFFFLYMLFFGMSVNCVPWVYVPEILPLEARTQGTAIGISSNWLWNFTVVSLNQKILQFLKTRY
jgi:MFS family permease